MNGPDFDHFCRLLKDRSGLALGAEKAYLVRNRLDPIARAEGLATAADLLTKLRKEPSEHLIKTCVTALATHESSFFRDGAPFEVLASQILPALADARRGQRSLRIWCAACSSGQEPYSLAITLQEAAAALPGWRFEILATDFSKPILDKAEAGLYSSFEVKRGLSPQRLDRWFKEESGSWRLIPQIRQMVSFKTHNLLQGTAGLGVFDIIFCRNVLIYFDLNGKKVVLDDLARALAPDGALFLGSAETILGLTENLTGAPTGRGLYRKRNASTATAAA